MSERLSFGKRALPMPPATVPDVFQLGRVKIPGQLNGDSQLEEYYHLRGLGMWRLKFLDCCYRNICPCGHRLCSFRSSPGRQAKPTTVCR